MKTFLLSVGIAFTFLNDRGGRTSLDKITQWAAQNAPAQNNEAYNVNQGYNQVDKVAFKELR